MNSLSSAAMSSVAPMRGVNATWWYTAGSVLFFEVMLVLVWAGTVASGFDLRAVLTVGITGLVWIAATIPLLLAYRHRSPANPLISWPHATVPIVVAALVGVVFWIVTGSWLMLVAPLAQSVALLNWSPGIRARMMIAMTVILAMLWAIDTDLTFFVGTGADGEPFSWFLIGFFSVFLPAMTVISLWWWDVLLTLDRARVAEARLAATQERLRVAADVHDLQGHHLQVIALQLELAERLTQSDPAESLRQLRLARESVDAARQGTRDLATRFRGVSLSDEIANAEDLLRAAGLVTTSSVCPDVDRAPSAVLGPVIRETTTNVLRHGGGRSAHLQLDHDDEGWRFTITNDTSGNAESLGDENGSGIAGMTRRLADVGGSLETQSTATQFAVVAHVPSGDER